MAHSLCWFIICCNYIRQVCTCIRCRSYCCFPLKLTFFSSLLSPDPYHAVMCSVVCWCMFLCFKEWMSRTARRQAARIETVRTLQIYPRLSVKPGPKLHSQGSKRGNGSHCHQDRSPRTWLGHVQDLCPRGGPGVRRRGVGPSSQRSACSKSPSLA